MELRDELVERERAPRLPQRERPLSPRRCAPPRRSTPRPRSGSGTPRAIRSRARDALGLARRQDRLARKRPGLSEPVEIARHVGVEDVSGLDLVGIDVEREHAVGEFASRPGRAVAGERAAEQFAQQREARALVLAERADRAQRRARRCAGLARQAGRRAARDRRRARRRGRSAHLAAAACRPGSRH